MNASTLDIRSLAPAERLRVQAEAARTLDGGGSIVIPADTGYLVVAAASSAAATELARVAGASGVGLGAAVWLARDTAAILGAIPGLNGVFAKIIRVLSPGPAVFVIQLDEAAISTVREQLGVSPGVVDASGSVLVRACGPSVAGMLAERTPRAIACWEPSDGAGRSILSASDAAAAAHVVGMNPGLVISDGSPAGGGSRGRPSVVALERSGAVRVLVEGAYETRYVMKQATLNVLFVCTGNTCRSPMAEAIAAGLVARRGGPGPHPAIHVSSAGVGAAHGAGRTPEATRAVREHGFEAPKGTSRPLTRQIIAEADLIYTMTRSHLDGVLALDPSARSKSSTLDPAGGDIADPIGLPQAAYNEVAERLEGLVRGRLKEWMP